MAKPENPGNGNGNGNNGNGEDDASAVVIVRTIDEDEERFEGTSRITVDASGSLHVGKGPVAVFGPDQWVKAWTEPLAPPAAP